MSVLKKFDESFYLNRSLTISQCHVRCFNNGGARYNDV